MKKLLLVSAFVALSTSAAFAGALNSNNAFVGQLGFFNAGVVEQGGFHSTNNALIGQVGAGNEFRHPAGRRVQPQQRGHDSVRRGQRRHHYSELIPHEAPP